MRADRGRRPPRRGAEREYQSHQRDHVHRVRARVRRGKKSHVLFMPQYAGPWKHRILQSTIDAVRHYPEFPQGSRTWDERVYHPDANGAIRPLSELWPGRGLRAYALDHRHGAVDGRGLVSGGLRMAWSESDELRLALGEQES